MSATVLVVDDDERDRAMLSAMVTSLGHHVETAVDGEEALAKINEGSIALVLTDLMMPRVDGFRLLRTLMARGQHPPAIVLSGFGSIEHAVSVVHDLQAFWFLEKPPQLDVLKTLIHRALAYGKLSQEAERLQKELSYQSDLVGTTPEMKELFALIERVAPTQASVLITGESGTGKEMVARAIHQMSARSAFPFVAINCAALPHDLIESELFGHEKGAFTGAVGRHPGCFEQADGGTLLLDEIADMPMVMQARLLRVLEESKVRPLGGKAEIPVNVRVLAATNRRLEGLEKDRLREDLFYRLNVFHLHIPPLRERKEDIPLLSLAIIQQLNRKHGAEIAHLHADTLERLVAYSWPGNVRQLRNVLEWAVITCGERTILPEHLPRAFNAPAASTEPAQPPEAAADRSAFSFDLGRALEDVEMAYIQSTLQMKGDNRKEAARSLRISLRTLYNRLARSARSKRDSLANPVKPAGEIGHNAREA